MRWARGLPVLALAVLTACGSPEARPSPAPQPANPPATPAASTATEQATCRPDPLAGKVEPTVTTTPTSAKVQAASDLAVATDGTTYVVEGDSNTVDVRRPGARTFRTLLHTTDHVGSPFALRLRHGRLFVAGQDGLAVYDPATGDLVASAGEEGDSLGSFAFTRDGGLVVTSFATDPVSILRLDAADVTSFEAGNPVDDRLRTVGTVAGTPTGLTEDPLHPGRLVVVDYDTGLLSSIDTATGRTSRLRLPGAGTFSGRSIVPCGSYLFLLRYRGVDVIRLNADAPLRATFLRHWEATCNEGCISLTSAPGGIEAIRYNSTIGIE